MTLRTIVMLRVHTIHLLRVLIGAPGFSVLMFGAALYGIGREVWVARVFENAGRIADPLSLLQFSVHAWSETSIVVQLLVGVSILALLILARETAKLLAPTLGRAAL